jgi:hypothetical protein
MCYDDASEKGAKEAFEQYRWARVVRLPDSEFQRYMEGVAFLELLPSLRHEWADVDMVGTLSWRAPAKIDVSKLERACVDVFREGFEAVAFMPSHLPFGYQASRCHPRFGEVWLALMEAMGVPFDDMEDDIVTFFCNYWVATPRVMSEFCEFYRHAIEALEGLPPNVHEALWADSTYPTHVPIERLLKVYGRPYMPLHPFVGERLACLFFHVMLDKLAIAPLDVQVTARAAVEPKALTRLVNAS